MAGAPWEAVVAGFAGECERLAAVLVELDEPDHRLPTNCPPWDLKDLVVHLLFSGCTLPQVFAAPQPDAVPISAADYYRRAERASDRYRAGNVDRTQRAARRFATGRAAVEALDAAWRATADRLRRADPAQTIPGPADVERDGALLPATAITIADHMITRVIAVAAHAVDVAISLGREPWTTTGALTVVTPTLLDLWGHGDPRPALGWDDVALLATATGRRPLTPEARDVLGSGADRFPLLS